MPDLDRVLAADLRDLVADLGPDDHTRTSVAMLEHHLQRAVPSALGLTLVLAAPPTGAPVRVNVLRRALAPAEIAAVLEVPLDALVPEAEGSVVLYASHPRAFDHLAAALGLGPDDLGEQPAPPTRVLEPGIEGLRDRAVVDRGLGVLLNRGHDLDGARTALQQRAEESGTDLAAAARSLLDRSGRPAASR